VRLVFDTNVLIAAFISRGHCHELLEHAARSHELLTSEFILGEFKEKLSGKLRIETRLVDAAIELQRSRMRVVEPAMPATPVARDPDHDWILATAVAAEADGLVTGDSDLLDLGEYRGIPILSPGAFWEFEARGGGLRP